MNVELLRDAVLWAVAQAELGAAGKWHQETWSVFPTDYHEAAVAGPGSQTAPAECGTSFCIAGWICAQSGDRFTSGHSTPNGVELAGVATTDGHVQTVSDRATDLLGISHGVLSTGEEPHLFHGGNSLLDVYQAAEELAVYHGEALFHPTERGQVLARIRAVES